MKENKFHDRHRAKKRFGQHFLKDEEAARSIAESVPARGEEIVLEIGPGTGMLTQFLLPRFGERYRAVEIDRDLIPVLKKKFPAIDGKLLQEDFLKLDLAKISAEKIIVVGNFPYNISTEIVFRTLEMREKISCVVGMFQKEVARRIVAQPGGKEYGIISVLLPVWYDREYLFELQPDAFEPPPKVHSAVVRLTRNSVSLFDGDEKVFIKVVKTAFNQRRKKLRNSLAGILESVKMQESLFDLRPEQLNVQQFQHIAKMIS